MDKKEFLEKLEAKKKAIKIIPKEYEEDINQLKEKIVSIVQEDFISSIPRTIVGGEKIKLQSRIFCIEYTESGCYIEYGERRVRIKENYNTGYVLTDRVKTVIQLNKEIEEELSEMIGRKIENSLHMASKMMLFECYY